MTAEAIEYKQIGGMNLDVKEFDRFFIDRMVTFPIWFEVENGIITNFLNGDFEFNGKLIERFTGKHINELKAQLDTLHSCRLKNWNLSSSFDEKEIRAIRRFNAPSFVEHQKELYNLRLNEYRNAPDMIKRIKEEYNNQMLHYQKTMSGNNHREKQHAEIVNYIKYRHGINFNFGAE